MSYQIKNKIWLESNGHVFLAYGRVRLLQSIEKTGSLSKAAKELNMSYKKAWTIVDKLNTLGREKVVSTSIGGKNGGGTSLTSYGEKCISSYLSFEKKCQNFINENAKSLEL